MFAFAVGEQRSGVDALSSHTTVDVKCVSIRSAYFDLRSVKVMYQLHVCIGSAWSSVAKCRRKQLNIRDVCCFLFSDFVFFFTVCYRGR
jgi:hypothetical protein